MNVDAARSDLALRTWRGANNILAGVILWSAFGVLGMVLPDSFPRALLYLFGAGVLWPLGLLVGSVLRVDLFARGNPLAGLTGVLGGMQILFAPLMVGAYFATPALVPWYLAVLVGAHFLPFAWLFGSRAYGFAAAALSLAGGLSGWLFPESTFVITPFAVAAVLLLTLLLLAREIAGDRRVASASRPTAAPAGRG